jgi:glutaredoxin 3
MSAEVLIYTTTYCPYCVRAKQLFNRKKVPFIEVNVEERPELREWLVTASGQRTVPQVFVNGRSVGGFSELDGLDRAGELDQRLALPPTPDMVALPR